MRTIKELLILLREKLPEYIPTHCRGLCATTLLLWVREIIDYEEMDLIDKYLLDKRPVGTPDCGYWWPEFKLAPRLEFLDKLIAEL
jgi:hypothetical protein